MASDFEFALFPERRAQWYALRERMIMRGRFPRLGEHEWLRHWHNLYDDLEAMYVWVKAIRKEADENVEAVIDRALENKTIQGRTV